MWRLTDRIQLGEKPNDFLAVGELLVDMISERYDDIIHNDTYHKFFGGSASNLALNVKKLGHRSVVASAVGRDGFGEFLKYKLEQAGIPLDYIQEADCSTSMVVVSKSKTSPVPIFYRGADYHLSYTPELENAVKNSKIVHFSCWPISMPPSRSTIEKAIETARANGTFIGFDPNYHPMIWNKGEDGVAYVKSIISRVDVIKPSEDDAERLFGKDTPENQIRKFLDLGARLVVMTLGKDGSIVSNGTETVWLNSIATQVVDATGAGDAFWAGFYTGVLRGYPILEAVKIGSAVSAHKLKCLGPVAQFPDLEEMMSSESYRGMEARS